MHLAVDHYAAGVECRVEMGALSIVGEKIGRTEHFALSGGMGDHTDFVIHRYLSIGQRIDNVMIHAVDVARRGETFVA